MKGLLKTFDVIERVGNKIPNPFWLFWILAACVIVLSAILAGIGVSAVNPATGKTVAVQSLISADGLQTIIGDAVTNYATFPPLATIITVLLGISVAQRSGLIDSLLHRMVARVPARFLTFALVIAAMVSHVAGDAAYVTMIPLGALIFRAAGRSPLLGVVVTYVAIAAGYDASPSLTSTDVLLSGISTAAAHTIDPNYFVSPVSNYFFGLASSVLIALVITVVTETVLARHPHLNTDEDFSQLSADDQQKLEGTAKDRKALNITGIVAVLFILGLIASLIPHTSPLRGEDAGILNSVVFTGMAFILGFFFALLGAVYGFVSGNFTKPTEIITGMVEGVKSLAPILVLFFAISQFLAYFKWTKMGEVLAISGSDMLARINAPAWAILLGIIVIVTIMNFFITSGSALWALAAPVFIPMLMLLHISPEVTQAAYRIADSVTNCVTPMSPYFVMALGFMQQYKKKAGIGTLASFTIPLSVVIWVVWVAFFLIWYLIGIPVGPGAPAAV